MPQFVILRHTLPADSDRADHFDLMLEDDGTQLLTWAIQELPSKHAKMAEELPLHRRDYLTFEGPVSNNRGEVTRVAEGTFEWLQRDECERIALLKSPQINGRLHLRRQDGKRWLAWLTSEQ